MITQSKTRKKVSGGMKQPHRKKKLRDFGNRPTLTKVDKPKNRVDRSRGANQKIRSLKTNIANVYNPKDKKFKKASIKNVVENPSNRHYARANIMTLGAVIDTDLGKARVTSRPGQEGVINAILIADTKAK